MEKMGDDAFGNTPVGSGPMEVVKWARDDYLELKTSKEYWKNGIDGKPLPYLDGAIFEYRTDTAVMVLELRAGTLDIVEAVEPKDIPAMIADHELALLESPSAVDGYFMFGFNQQMPLFANNKNLRLAFQYGVDRESMAKALGFGYAWPGYYPRWVPGMLGYDDSLPKYAYDPAKSKQLLTEAGYPDGIDINLVGVNRSAEIRMAEMIKAMWDKIGMRTTVDVMDRVAWSDKVKNMDFQVTYWRGRTVPDAGLNISQLGTGGNGNWSSWSNKDFDQCMDEGNRTYDQNERDRIFKRCLKILVDDAFVGVGYEMAANWGVNKRVQDLGYKAWATLDLGLAWLNQ